MNGAHDMGGMHRMGAILREENQPVFHAEWESRVLAMSFACGAWRRWNIDMVRFARENVPARDYLNRSYYETWLHGLVTLLLEKELVAQAELHATKAGEAIPRTEEPPLKPEMVAPGMARGASARVNEAVTAKFSEGDTVRVVNRHCLSHTRAPRYARGRAGKIVRDHGVFVFPDTNAIDGNKKPQHVYAVRFTARELWGDGAAPNDTIMVDLWDDYLERA